MAVADCVERLARPCQRTEDAARRALTAGELSTGAGGVGLTAVVWRPKPTLADEVVRDLRSSQPIPFRKTEDRTTQRGCKRRGVASETAPLFRTLVCKPHPRVHPDSQDAARKEAGDPATAVCAVWDLLRCERAARAPQMTPAGHDSAASLTDDMRADQAIGHDGPPEPPLRAPQAERHQGGGFLAFSRRCHQTRAFTDWSPPCAR